MKTTGPNKEKSNTNKYKLLKNKKNLFNCNFGIIIILYPNNFKRQSWKISQTN